MQYKDVRINKNLRNFNSYNVSSFTGSYIYISYLPKHANSMYLQLTKPPNALIKVLHHRMLASRGKVIIQTQSNILQFKCKQNSQGFS